MSAIKKTLIYIAGLLVFGANLFAYTGLTRTSSNTIMFTDDYTSSININGSGVNTYITAYSGGKVQAAGVQTGNWDPPTLCIGMNNNNNTIYVAHKISTHAMMGRSGNNGLPTFNGSSGGSRMDVYLQKYDENGNKKWASLVRLRSRDDGMFYFDNIDNRYPNIEIDEANDTAYVVWTDRLTNKFQVVMQKIDGNGNKVWGDEKVIVDSMNPSWGSDVVSAGNYLYVFYTSGNFVYGQRVKKSDGSLVGGPVQINTVSTATRYARAELGQDGKLYVLWRSTAIRVYMQRLQTNSMAKLSWGGTTADHIINTATNSYTAATYYYNSDNGLNMDMDTNNNIYIVWSAKRDNAVSIYGMAVNYSNTNTFQRTWASDVRMSPGVSGDVYPDVAISFGTAYLAYVIHDADKNDQTMIQKFNRSTGSTNIAGGMRYSSYSHDVRIGCFKKDSYLYQNAYSSCALRKYDNVNNVIWTKSYNDRQYATLFYYSTLGILPGTVKEARVIQDAMTWPSGALTKYWISPNGGASIYGPVTLNSGNGAIASFPNITNLGNDFRLYVVGDNNANNGAYGSLLAIDQLSIEATKVLLGDVLVGQTPDGSGSLGNLILNSTADQQNKNAYVYNNGSSAANIFFFVKNNGNISYTVNGTNTNYYDIRVKGNAGNATWTVTYWLCDANGNTNRNITSQITGIGLATNLKPFNNNEWMIIRAYAKPTNTLGIGSAFTISLSAEGEVDAGYAFHDKASFNAIVSFASPDLMLCGKSSSYLGLDFTTADGSAGQTLTWVADTNVTRVFRMKLRNAGGASQIRLRAEPNPDKTYWDLEYYTNAIKVTGYITNASGMLLDMANEEYLSNISVVIKPKWNAPLTSSLSVQVWAVATSDMNKYDYAKVRVFRSASKPDLKFGTTYDNTYSTNNPMTQTQVKTSDNAITNTYTVTLQNDGNTNMDIAIAARKQGVTSAGWKVMYYYGTTNIGTAISNSYFILSNMPAAANRDITVYVVTPTAHNAGANETMLLSFAAVGEGDTNGRKWDTASVQDICISSKPDAAIDGLNIGSIETGIPTAQSVTKYIYTNTNFTIIISNSASSSYRIKTTAATPDFGFSASYTNSGADITAAITNTGWKTLYTAGQKKTISVKVVSGSAAIGMPYEVTISSVSETNSADVDNIKFKVEKAVAPDMRARKAVDTIFIGSNSFHSGTDPASSGQEIASSYPIGSTNWYRYIYKAVNMRLVPETIRLKAVRSVTGWRVKYFSYIGSDKNNPNPMVPGDWNDITTTISNGTGYDANNVASGDFAVFKIEIQSSASHMEGDKVNVDITATGQTTKFRDVFRIATIYGMGTPDLVFSGLFNNLYANDYSGAVGTTNADKAKGTRIYYTIQNDSVSNDGAFFVRGTRDESQVWHIRYFNDSSQDITAAVVGGSGYPTGTIAKGGNKIYSVQVDASNSVLDFSAMTNVNIRVSTEQDEAVDYLRIQTRLTDIGRPDLVFGANGNNSYAAVGALPIVSNIYVRWGETVTLTNTVQNDRTVAEKLRLFALRGSGKWKVKYMTNNVDVTGSITNKYLNRPNQGGLDANIAGSGNIKVVIQVTLESNCNLEIGQSNTFTFYAYSEGRLKSDQLAYSLIVRDTGKPDIVRLPSLMWNNVYENNPVAQSFRTNTQKEWNNTTLYLLQNDSGRQESMTLKIAKSDTNWGTKYYYFHTGSMTWKDISSELNTNKYQFLLPANSSVTLSMQTLLDGVKSNKTLGASMNLNLSFISWMGFVTDSMNVSYSNCDMTVPDIRMTNGDWNNVYESDTVTSSTNKMGITIEKGVINSYYMYIENDSTVRSNDFYLYADKSVAIVTGITNWWAKYYKNPTLDNYTYQTVVESNNVTMLGPNERRYIQVDFGIPTNSKLATNTTVKLKLKVRSEYRQNSDMAEIRVKYVDKGNPDIVYVKGGKGDGSRNIGDQLSNAMMEFGDVSKIRLILQNDRTDRSDKMFYFGSFIGSDPYFSIGVSYLSNGTEQDIKTKFVAKTFNPIIPMNSQITTIITMSLASNCSYATNQNTQNQYFYLTTLGASCTDTVKLSYQIADMSKPDLFVADKLGWSNLIESVSAYVQTTNVYLEIGHTNLIEYFFMNGRSKGERFTISSIPNETNRATKWGFVHQLSNTSAWSNIASLDARGQKIWTNLMTGNTKKRMRMKVYIPYDFGTSYTNKVNDSMSVLLSMKSWMGFKYDKMRVNYIFTDPGKPNIRKSAGQWAQVTNISSNQTESISIEKGISNSFTLYLTNERSTFDRFYLYANLIDWNSVFYLKVGASWSNITSLITNNNYALNFTAGEVKQLRVNLFIGYENTNVNNTRKSVYVAMRSYKSKTADKVRLLYTLVDKSRPDIVVNNTQTNGFYSYSGYDHTNHFYLEKGEKITIPISYENDSPDRNYSYVVQGYAIETNWKIIYEISNGGNLSNITSQITNAGLIQYYTNTQKVSGEMELMLTTNSPLTGASVFTNRVRMYTLARLYIEQADLLLHVTDRGNPKVYFNDYSQVSNLIMKRKETNVFNMVMSNARSDSRFAGERMLVKLNSTFLKGWGYKVIVGGATVTAQVTNQGYEVFLTNGVAVPVQVTINMDNNNTNLSGLTNNVKLLVYSQGRLLSDFTTIGVIKQEPQPDISVISLSKGWKYGDGMYSAVYQTNNGFVIVNNPAIYSIIVENDDVIPDIIEVQALGDIDQTNKWKIELTDDETSESVYTMLRNKESYPIGSGKSKMFILSLKIIGTVGMNETNSIRFIARSKIDTNKFDEFTVYTVRVPVKVSGKIYATAKEDTNTTIPISAATVILKSKFSTDTVTATTTSEGLYEMTAIPGTYELVVQCKGYVDAVDTVTVKEIEKYEIADLKMLRVNLDEDDTKVSVHSFPNPVSVRDPITILVNQPEDGNLRIEVYDLQGKLLKSFINETKNKGVYTYHWDSRDKTGAYLKRGVYLLMVISGTKQPELRKIFIK